MMPFESDEVAAESRILELNSWQEFEEKLQWLNTHVVLDGEIDKRLEEPLFRGQAHHHSSWKLETTLERLSSMEKLSGVTLLSYYRKIAACKPQLESLTGRRWPEAPDYPTFSKHLLENPYGWLDMFLNREGGYEYLVYLRHHGFPSPLLDWTASPYIAAFFAFDQPHHSAQHVCVYAFLRKQLSSGSSERHFFIVGPYMRTDKRHYLQQCRYSMCVKASGDDFSFLSHDQLLADDNGDQGELFEFRIPIEERTTALQRLELMNINPYSLFASEDALVRSLARRECSLKAWEL